MSTTEFVSLAFQHVGLDWRQHVVCDPQFYRPAEVEVLLADSKKAAEKLGWKPEVSFEQLVRMMVDADMAMVENAR